MTYQIERERTGSRINPRSRTDEEKCTLRNLNQRESKSIFESWARQPSQKLRKCVLFKAFQREVTDEF